MGSDRTDAGQTPRIMRWLWRVYFRPRPWERSGRVYEAVGVRQIKELLFGGRYFNALVSMIQGRRYRPFRGQRWPQRWLRFTVGVEIGHLVIGLYMLVRASSHLSGGDGVVAGRILLLNVLVNFYPVVVQRFNRARLVRIFDEDGLIPWQ